jgi:hypothetical protein
MNYGIESPCFKVTGAVQARNHYYNGTKMIKLLILHLANG